jgi:hypothetical protein
VQLAAADEHRADLGQLAQVAAEPVGLDVDDQVLGASQVHRRIPRAGADGPQRIWRCPRSGANSTPRLGQRA